MRALTLLITAVVLAKGRPVGPVAAPALSMPEYSVESRLIGVPIVDHPTTLQTTVTAQPGLWLDANYAHAFDVGGGCCFERTRYEPAKLQRCARDESKICAAVFEVPYRLSGAGLASGSVTFSVCDEDGCRVKQAGVLVPYQTKD